MRSPFGFVKISDYGTSTPVVARTVHQAHLLLKFFPVPEEFRHRVTKLMWEVQRHLLKCYRISETMCREIREAKMEFAEGNRSVEDADKVPTPPWIMDLESQLESFLTSAKLAVRDAGAILTLFFDQDFGHRFDKALRWAKERFGKDDPLVQVIETHYSGVKEIVDMRNAVEHPADGPRRRLQVRNFSLQRDRGSSGFALAEPIWELAGEPPSLVVQDLPTMLDCLLRLCEEVYVCSLMKMETPIPIEIVEIPEAERDPNAPVRFRSVAC